MNTSLFRKSSLKRISSPDQLDEYIRVANPGVWLLLIALCALVAGAVVWGIWGRVNSTLDCYTITENGKTLCYVPETEAAKLAPGMQAHAGDVPLVIEEILPPAPIDPNTDSYYLHLAGIEKDHWAVEVRFSGEFEEGIQSVRIIYESLVPASLIFN